MVNDTSEHRWYELLRITRSWRLEWDLEQLLQRVAREAVEFLQFDRGCIFLLGADGLLRRALYVRDGGLSENEADVARIADKVARSGRPIFAHVVDKQGNGAEKKSDSGVGSACCVPLTGGRGILGALYADSHQFSSVRKQNQEFLEMLALQAAAALEHAILYHSAITDPLTGLYSHRHFQQEVEQAVRRALRADQKLSLFILDLDRFKALNDSEGHEIGNRCLVGVAALLRSTLRSTDVIARFGGDEFEVLLPDTQLSDALAVAEKIRTKIEELRFSGNRSVAATIGAAAFPDNATDAQQLFLRADEALYQAKEGGRNRVAASSARANPPEGEQLRGSAALTRTAMVAVDMLANRAESEPEISPAIPERSTAEQIDGYSLVRRLGIGSMGEVLLVNQPELERDVALKRPLTPHLTPEQVHAFEREAKVTASLNHPGVITVLSLGRDSDGRRYYTMKPLNGLSLAQILELRQKGDVTTARTYTLRRLLEIVQRVSETIAYAHQRNVHHLDLTPSNVVIGEFGEVTVIDWGFGASVSSGRRPSNYHLKARLSNSGKLAFLVGSAGSLAPEQLPGSTRPPGAPTDVHALGAMLYQALTGSTPYASENTRDLLNSIVHGSIPRPEKVAPKAGIDPSLSALCMEALQKDLRQRPTAAEFAQRLGRYVRREAEFQIVTYGSGANDQKLDWKDWQVHAGQWEIVGDEFVSKSQPGCTAAMFWKTSVPASFRFICEGWIERQGEICLFGRQRLNSLDFIQAYGFGFGAEWNTCTKLSSLASIAGRVPKPGTRYRLELEYNEGWVYCYIDGELVFEHRELFHFAGNYIGISTWDPGVHFKPIEIQRQTWGMNVPAAYMADGYYHAGQFQKAAELYEELSDRLGDRLEGLEARLKLGLCLATLGEKDRAREIFKSLHGGSLEPYAMGEEAMMDYATPPAGRPQQSLKLLAKLLRTHPDDAPLRYMLDSSYNVPRMPSLSETHRLRATGAGLALSEQFPPTMLTIGAITKYMDSSMCLGEWKQALEQALDFQKRLCPGQHDIGGFRANLCAAALSCGREDLLPDDPFALERWHYYDYRWPCVTPVAEAVIRKQGCAEFIEEVVRRKRTIKFHDENLAIAAVLKVYLASRREKDALRWFERNGAKYAACGYYEVCIAAALLIDMQRFDRVREFLRSRTVDRKDFIFNTHGMIARSYIEQLDFEAAAKSLHAVATTDEPISSLFTVMRIMLASLGLLRISRKQIRAWLDTDLAGAPRDLAAMFTGLKPPKPGKLWPHPHWRPEWRLWLALWLEAKGKRGAAREIALPARDPRYGLANSQPAIEALLKRTSRALP